MKEWMDEEMNEGMTGWMKEWVVGWIDIGIDGRMGMVGEYMDERRSGWMDGRMKK